MRLQQLKDGKHQVRPPVEKHKIGAEIQVLQCLQRITFAQLDIVRKPRPLKIFPRGLSLMRHVFAGDYAAAIAFCGGGKIQRRDAVGRTKLNDIPRATRQRLHIQKLALLRGYGDVFIGIKIFVLGLPINPPA